VKPQGWTYAAGDIEAEYMARCETIVMVFNNTSPAFAALAETGWAALGCVLRDQHFILQINPDFPKEPPSPAAASEGSEQSDKELEGWVTRSRYLVYKHAREFKHPRLHLVADISAVVAKLREIYAR
jgi:hypothetical protein